MDDPVGRVLFGAAGELQAEAHDASFAGIAEADLRRAMRHALRVDYGRRVHAEEAVAFGQLWKGRSGRVDLAVRADADASEHEILIELKWCREDTFYELLWDSIKMALAARLPGVVRSYLVV